VLLKQAQGSVIAVLIFMVVMFSKKHAPGKLYQLKLEFSRVRSRRSEYWRAWDKKRLPDTFHKV
jgi:hypothetical protein